MVNLDKIEEEILALEKRDTSYAVVERLAWLYIVRDHLREAAKKDARASEESSAASEFMAAVDGKNPDAAWKLVDELVESVRVTQPHLYETYMRKFEGLENARMP